MARRPRNNKTKNQREIKTKAYPPGILDKLKTILNDLCQTVALPPQIVSTLKNTISATLGIDSFSKIHNEISLFSASFAQEWKTNCTIAHTDLFIQDLSDSLLLPDLKNHDRSNCFNKEINSLLVSKYYSELQINKSSDSTWNEIKASIIKQHFGLKINSPVFLVENFYSSTDCIDVHEMVQNVQLASDRLRWNILKYHFMRALNIIKELPKLEIKVKESQDDVDSKFVEFQVENTVDMNQGVAKAVESDSSASERGSLTNTKELEIESTCLIAPEKVISISNKKNEHEIESTRLIVPEKIASISNTIESNRVIVAEKVTSISKTIEHEIDIKSTRVFEQAATFSNTNEQEIYIKSTQLFTPATTISNTNEQEIKSTPVYSAKQPYSWTHPVMEPYKKACHEPFAKPNCKLDKVHDFVSFIANELDYKKELSIKQIEADVLAFNGVAQIIYASCFATGSFVKRNDHNSFENLLIAYKFAINSKDNKRKKRPFQEINVPNFKLLDYDGKPKTLKLDKLPFVCLLIGDWIIQKRGIETNQELLDIAFSFYLQSVNRHYLPGLISCALMIGSGDKKIEKYVMLPIYMNVSIEFKDSFSMSKVGYLYRGIIFLTQRTKSIYRSITMVSRFRGLFSYSRYCANETRFKERVS